MTNFDRCLATLLLGLVSFAFAREWNWREMVAKAPPDVVVSVVGAVQRPAVIALPAGSRWGHAIAACGGFTAAAHRDQVHLARPLQDGDHLQIPTRAPEAKAKPEPDVRASAPAPAQPAPPSAAETIPEAPPRLSRRTQRPQPTEKPPAPSPSADEQLDINRASAQDLEALPGVGPVLAQRIVEARASMPQGSFSCLEELGAIRGIKAKTFSRLEPYLKIEER